MNTEIPEILIFQENERDAVGRKAELIKVKNGYAYYGVLDGASSKIFFVNIQELENVNQKYFFNDKELLIKTVIERLERKIRFIKDLNDGKFKK